MHFLRLIPFHKMGRPAAAAQELLQLLMLDAGQDGRVADLVAVEVQDRQHGPVGNGIEELVGMPRGRQGTRLRLAIADDAGNDQIGIVEHSPERMAERIAQLAALVDRARAFRRGVAGNSPGKGELDKELSQPSLILADIRIDFAVRAFEIGVAHDGRTAVPRAGDVNHVEVVFLDDPVQVHVDEVLPGGRAPMSQQHVLDIRQRQRSLQQRIIVQVDLADRQIVGRTPVGVHLVKQFGGQRSSLHGSILLFCRRGGGGGKPSWLSCVLPPCEGRGPQPRRPLRKSYLRSPRFASSSDRSPPRPPRESRSAPARPR